MYAKYVYTAGATIEQIHDDIFEIFCGETDVNNLSAGCDTANSLINTTLSTSPWVDFDDVSSTERIMRMEMSDDSGVFKYVGWHHDGTDEVGFAIMESWDNGPHTPTNEVVVSYDKEGMDAITGSGATMHIYSSQFCTIIMAFSPTTNVWGRNVFDQTYGSLGIFECSRDHPSFAIGDMPNWFLSSTAMFWGDSDNTMTATFWQGRDETDTVLTPFTAEMGYAGRDNFNSDTSSYDLSGIGGSIALENIGDDVQFFLEPILIGGSNSILTYDAAHYYGNVSERCDIWMMAPSTQEVGKIVIIDAIPFIVFKSGFTSATTGTIIGGKFVVPYG